jgi:uncharacterized membrane protein
MTSTRKSDWSVSVLLILLSLVPAAAGARRVIELVGGAPITTANARFVAAPVPVVLHVIAAIPFSALGAFQFSPALRRRRREWHRAAGRFLVVFGLVVALTGLWMAQFYAWPEGDGEILYLLRLVFGSAMVMSIVSAVGAIRRRDFVSHGAWMMRGYAIGMGAGTQVLTHVPWFILVGQPGELARSVLMGAGWVINLVVAEWIIRRQQPRSVAVPLAVPRMAAL